MIGIGAANLAAGFFQGFPVSTSGSRTAVAEQSGAKTQLTGIVGAGAIILMLVLVPGLLRNLPNPTLAAVVIAASLSLADVPGTVRLWHQRRVEFLLSIDRVPRCRAARRARRDRGRCRPLDPQRIPPGMVALPDNAGSHPGAARTTTTANCILTPSSCPAPVIFRFDGPLFFANARTFRDQIRRLAATDPRAAMDHDRRRTDHRHRHDRRRHAHRTRRGAQRRRHLSSSSPSSRIPSAQSSSATR